MRMNRKILAWLVAALMMISPIAALAAGGEAETVAAVPSDEAETVAAVPSDEAEATPTASLGGSSTLSFKWHNPSFVGEEENAVISSLLDAVALSGAYGMEGSTGYFNGDLLIDGESALPFDIYIGDQAMYINSPILYGATEIRFDQAMEIMQQQAMMNPELSTFLTGYAAAMEMQEGIMQQSAEGIEALAEGLQMDELLADLFDLLNTSVIDVLATRRPYYGIMQSTMGVHAEQTNVYTVTEDDLAEMCKALLTLMTEHEEYWDAIVSLYGPAFFDAMDVSREEVLAQVMGMFTELAESIESTDTVKICLYEGLDGRGNPALYQLKVEPIENDPEFFINMLEWAPGQSGFYFTLGSEYSSIEGKLERIRSGWNVYFTIHDWYETQAFMLAVTDVGPERGSLEFGQLLDGQLANGITLNFGADGDALEASLGIIMDAQREPVITARLTCADEPMGPRFDPDTFDGKVNRLFEMTPQEQAEWAEMIDLTVQQAGMRIAGMLPPDVYRMIMEDLPFFP